MKVLYIVGGEGNRYGSEIIAIDLISAGKKNGIEYVVVTANKGAVSEICDQLGIECYTIPFSFFVYKAMPEPLLNFVKKTIWRMRAEYLTRRAVGIIEKIVDLKSIDLIHTNLSRDLLGGILAERNNIPHVWHIHELYKAHYQLSFLKRNQVQWMSDHTDKFIAISKTVADEWIESGLSDEKVQIVYNGINIDDIKQKTKSASSENLKIVMVGHLVPAKGQKLVIQGLSALPGGIRDKIFFDCFGEGDEAYKKEPLKIAGDNNVKLRLRGYCSNIGNVLKDYDIGVNYSRGEGFGLSTVEYMAAGICPVVADTGANEELIVNRTNGLVFEYNNIESFSDSIRCLFENRNLMEELSEEAYKDAVSKYNISRMCEGVMNIYRNTSMEK